MCWNFKDKIQITNWEEASQYIAEKEIATSFLEIKDFIH